MKEDIKNKKYTFNDLSNIALECLKDYEEYLGIKTKFMILHLDEKTPHFQYFFTNFNDKGNSITNLNKTTDRLSPLQDIAHKHFGKLGIERGLKKDFTNSKHMSAAKYWQTLGVNLKDKTLSLEQQYNNRKIEVEKDLKSLYTEVNLQKNEVKDLRSNYDRTSQEYKDLTIVFKQLQVEEKTLREKVRELKEIDNLDNYLNDLKKDISKIIKSNVEKVDPLIGNSRIEVKNINKMYSELVSKISEPLHSKVKEVEEKDKTIEKLKEDIVVKDKEIAQKDTKIKDLTQTTKQLESAFMVNYKQLEAIKKDFKTKVANQIKRLNLINRLRRSNIAQRIRNRLSKKLNSNQIDR
jgi:chromosome segregation ATPase